MDYLRFRADLPEQFPQVSKDDDGHSQWKECVLCIQNTGKANGNLDPKTQSLEALFSLMMGGRGEKTTM